MNSWIAIGPVENWKIGTRENIWGVAPAYKNSWSRIRQCDELFYYATSPVKGVIGYGVVRDTCIEEKRLIWPEEVFAEHVLWPLRIRFESSILLPEDSWDNRKISLKRGAVVFQKGLQVLKPVVADALKKAFCIPPK